MIADFRPPSQWPQELEQAWRVEVGLGHSTPILVGERIAVQTRMGGDEVIQCLRLQDGAEIWRHADPVGEVKLARAVGRYQDSPRSTPAAAEGRIIALSVNGAVTCLDAKTGDAIWRNEFAEYRPAYPEFGAAASPLIANNICICVVGSEKRGAIVALDAGSGKLRWKLDVEGAAYSSPMLVELGGAPTIVVMSRDYLLGITLEGKKRWAFPYETRYEQNILTAVHQGDRLYISGYQNPVVALDASRGEPRQMWTNPDQPMYMSSPILHADRLYGMSQRTKGTSLLHRRADRPDIVGDRGSHGRQCHRATGGRVACVAQRPRDTRLRSRIGSRL